MTVERSPSSLRRRAAWAVLLALPVALIVFLAGALLRPAGDPGQLDEPLYDYDGAVPPFVDATSLWGLDSWCADSATQLAGGVTLAHLDGDSWLDMVVTAGPLAVFFGGRADSSRPVETDRIAPPRLPSATSTATVPWTWSSGERAERT